VYFAGKKYNKSTLITGRYNMTYGEKIATLRKENNLTQEQFAELLNVSRQAVSKWESCSAFPETEKLIKMSKLFSCSIDYLLNDENENRDSNPTQKNEKELKNYFLGITLTYLSFPPLFGFIVGIFSVTHHLRITHNRRMLILSILGSIISLILTVIMVKGFVLER
jgi:transcriptional regulator with XRE-family HTH domain